MRTSSLFLCVSSLVAIGACFDDVDPPQGEGSGSTSSAGTTGPATDTTTSVQDGSGTGTSSMGSTDAGTSGDVGSSSSGGIVDTTGGLGSTGEASTGEEGSSSSGETCVPLADGSAIGQDCSGGAPCPASYTCQPFAGFVFMESCQILCTQDCECPLGTTCNGTVDKTGIPWFQCG